MLSGCFTSTCTLLALSLLIGPYMGRMGGLLIASLQYFINLGSTITNIILTGQLLQSIYTDLCTGDAGECLGINWPQKHRVAWSVWAGALVGLLL